MPTKTTPTLVPPNAPGTFAATASFSPRLTVNSTTTTGTGTSATTTPTPPRNATTATMSQATAATSASSKTLLDRGGRSHAHLEHEARVADRNGADFRSRVRRGIRRGTGGSGRADGRPVVDGRKSPGDGRRSYE